MDSEKILANIRGKYKKKININVEEMKWYKKSSEKSK